MMHRLQIPSAALLLAALCAAIVGCSPALAQPPAGKGGKGAPGAPPPPKVLVAAAIVAEVPDQRTFVGTIEPIRRSLVGSAAPGRVEQFLVNEGDPVTKGQEIATLRRGIIEAEVNVAKGNLAVRQAELKELETSFQDEVEQAQARLADAQAQLAYRQSKMERSKALGTSVARELLEEDATWLAQTTAKVRENQAALRLLTNGARELKTEQARAQVEAAQAEVERLSEQYERHSMFSPFDGFVTAEHTEVGQWVMQGDPVAEIIELGSVDVSIAVLEDYIANLNTTVVGTVEVPSLPGQVFPGQIALINPQADSRARTFPVKVRVTNQFSESGQPLLKAGAFARVMLPIGQPLPRTLVPKDAIVLGGQSPMVYVVAGGEGKGAVRPVPVKLNGGVGLWMSVEGEVKAGDLLVVEGNERIRPGQEVRTETKDIPLPQ
jgi:RND family efflux transporter MFP subunit